MEREDRSVGMWKRVSVVEMWSSVWGRRRRRGCRAVRRWMETVLSASSKELACTNGK